MVLEKTLENPLDCKEIQPVHPKGNQSWIGRTDAEAETPIFCHLMWRADSFEKTLMLGKIEGRRRRGWQRMRWLDGITHSMDMSLGELGVGDGQGNLACRSSWGHKELDTTGWLNWTELNSVIFRTTERALDTRGFQSGCTRWSMGHRKENKFLFRLLIYFVSLLFYSTLSQYLI